MKIIYNNILPFNGYKLINIFGFLFVRSKYKGKLTFSDINHEYIHTKQMEELGYIFFYIIYILEWLFRFLFTKDKFTHKAYRNISFEKEAYSFQNEINYLDNRKHYSQWK